jgi:isoleucyl-tRNA synthetase
MAGNRPLRAGHDAPAAGAVRGADYGKYEFHRVVQSLQTFCSEDLGGFYLDILKDRLYTTAAGSKARRSAQSALWHITQTLTKLMAPILSFTAEEVWQGAGGDADDSVMLHTWQPLPAPATKRTARQVEQDPRLSRRRHARARRTAHRRQDRLVAAGRSHAARDGEKYEILASLGDDLRFVFICSKTTLIRAPRRSSNAPRWRTPSASAAGTCAKTSAPTPSTRPLRPLREQPARRGRNTCLRVTSTLAVAGRDHHPARPDQQVDRPRPGCSRASRATSRRSGTGC